MFALLKVILTNIEDILTVLLFGATVQGDLLRDK
jgi:hypothetical protein